MKKALLSIDKSAFFSYIRLTPSYIALQLYSPAASFIASQLYSPAASFIALQLYSPTASYIALQLYSADAELYCFAVIFG